MLVGRCRATRDEPARNVLEARIGLRDAVKRIGCELLLAVLLERATEFVDLTDQVARDWQTAVHIPGFDKRSLSNQSSPVDQRHALLGRFALLRAPFRLPKAEPGEACEQQRGAASRNPDVGQDERGARERQHARCGDCRHRDGDQPTERR